jgi:hypothetical protein
MIAQLIHGYLQRLAAPWAVFNVMPCLCGIRGGEGSRHRIGTHLKCPAAVLAPPGKRGHWHLLFVSNIHNISRNANPRERSFHYPTQYRQVQRITLSACRSFRAEGFPRSDSLPNPEDQTASGRSVEMDSRLRIRSLAKLDRPPGDRFSQCDPPIKTLPFLSGFLDIPDHRRYNLFAFRGYPLQIPSSRYRRWILQD